MKDYDNFHLLNHPIIQAKLARLRDRRTEICEYRKVLGELGTIIGYEAARDMKLKANVVETITTKTETQVLDERVALIPLLRGGLAMVEEMLLQFRNAQVFHLGLKQDQLTHAWVSFYCKLPADLSDKYVMLLEPSLITGSKTSMAVDFLKNHGAKRIKCISIVSTAQAVDTFCQEHPDVDLYVAAIDPGVDEEGRMVPGIGDSSDRVLGR